MPGPIRCTGEIDARLNRRIALLLERNYRAEERRELAQRREQLQQAFYCLSVPAARPLLERLRTPHYLDPLTMAFMRLPRVQREELLGSLERTLGVSSEASQRDGPVSLPPAAAQLTYLREIESHITEVLKLSKEDQLRLADQTLRSLRQLSSDPRFVEVDKNLIRQIETETATLENRLQKYAMAQRHNVVNVQEGSINWAALGLVAAADGPSPVGDAVALGTAAILAVGLLFSSRDVRREVLDPTLTQSQAEELSQLLREVSRRIPEPSPQPRIPFPQPDPGPPGEDTRRRRDSCQGKWVPRPTGTHHMKRHNEFAAAMIAKFKIAAPDQDYRLTKGNRRSTDYDSYDSQSNTYWEFKTRHDYIALTNLSITWLRLSGIVSQAYDQRLTLEFCGFEGDLVWVFEQPQVASAVREYIGGWPVDRVLAEPWEQK